MKTRLYILLALSVALVVLILTFPDFNRQARHVSTTTTAEIPERPLGGTIPTADITNRNLEYFYYVPPGGDASVGLPVLIVIPGLDGSGAPYVMGRWREFAQKNGFAVVSPTFRFNNDDWQKQRSYQFPAVWSGQAMLAILDSIGKKAPIDKNRLFLFGHSAGGQYVHRFALLFPERCKAVAAHAPGGVTLPVKTVPVKFLITVGQNDADRLEKARGFAAACRAHTISVDFKEYPGVGHELCDDAVQRSLDFFAKVKSQE